MEFIVDRKGQLEDGRYALILVTDNPAHIEEFTIGEHISLDAADEEPLLLEPSMRVDD